MIAPPPDGVCPDSVHPDSVHPDGVCPDIVIILTDEERAAPPYENDELRAWRDTKLPARKWFVDHGVEFRRHYVASTACVPSRPSLLTGHYPDVHGVTQTNGLGKRSEIGRASGRERV